MLIINHKNHLVKWAKVHFPYTYECNLKIKMKYSHRPWVCPLVLAYVVFRSIGWLLQS
jgi:hypothetical protein